MSLNVRASLALLFDRGDFDDSILSISRPNNATRVDEQGKIQVAPADTPRFDYDPVTGELKGLLIEESRTNYIVNSENFQTWTRGTNTTVTPSAALSPDGTMNATRLIHSAPSSSWLYTLNEISGITTGEKVTLSLYVKAVSVGIDDQVYIKFRYSNNSYIHQAQFTATGEWQRISATFTLDASYDTSGGMWIDNGSSSLLDAYIWGAQIERGSFPTSYIPTSGASATRSADDCDITGANFTDFYNHDEGTLITEFDVDSLGVDKSGVTIDSGANTNRIIHSLGYSGADVGAVSIRDGANNTLNITAIVGTYKVGSTHLAGSFKAFVNGSLLGEHLVDPPNSLNNLKVGRSTTNTSYLNGHIKRVIYFPKALSDSLMEKLTSELTF